MLSQSEIHCKVKRGIISMRPSKHTSGVNKAANSLCLQGINKVQKPRVSVKPTWERSQQNDTSRNILTEKFKEQRFIFVEEQYKWDRKLNRSIEPTETESELDLNVIASYELSLTVAIGTYCSKCWNWESMWMRGAISCAPNRVWRYPKGNRVRYKENQKVTS